MFWVEVFIIIIISNLKHIRSVQKYRRLNKHR